MTYNRYHLALLAPALLLLISTTVSAQRPLLDDRSEVQGESRGRMITRGPKSNRAARKATNAVLVVLTDPPGAAISINGRAAGRSDDDGEFQTELPAGRAYTVQVSAAGDYAPFAQRVTLQRRQTSIVRAALLDKYGLLVIGPAQEGGRVTIDGRPAAHASFNAETNEISISRVEPGRREVVYDHPDLLPVRKVFDPIESGKLYRWIFRPVPAVVELTIRTTGGAVVSVGDASFCGAPEDSPFRVLVRPGRHVVRLSKDGYEDYVEEREFVVGRPATIEARLVPIPEFRELFDANLSNWAAPRSWRIEEGRLVVSNSPQLGMPTGIAYANCNIAFQLRLSNDVAASWAVRAQDAQHYYLFVLFGPRGRFPNQFRSYIVRAGTVDLANPAATADLPIVLTRADEYTVTVRAEGPVITHTITPASTGVAVNLDYFKDPSPQHWVRGSFGFRTVTSEEFTVDDLIAEPIRSE